LTYHPSMVDRFTSPNSPYKPIPPYEGDGSEGHSWPLRTYPNGGTLTTMRLRLGLAMVYALCFLTATAGGLAERAVQLVGTGSS
jgi:hypothetical protein